jgi:hypothetical protein
VEQGAEVDKANKDGWTPLLTGAQKGHFAVVQYLVEHGADIDKATSAGTTPLMAAEAAGRTVVAAYLRAAGAREAGARRNEVAAEYERRLSESRVQDSSSNLGGMQQQTPEQIRELIRQEAALMSRQAQALQIETDFKSKIAAERMADPDFADLYDALNIEAHPELIIWANSMDNTAQIVKDLAKNPTKYANILMLAKSASPRMAQIELNKLSQSIKSNLEAQKQPVAPAPLSQIKPSNIGVDNGSFEVSDFRAQPWLRG